MIKDYIQYEKMNIYPRHDIYHHDSSDDGEKWMDSGYVLR